MQEQKVLFIFLLIFLLIYSVKQRTALQKKRCIIFLTVILTLFSGLRSWHMGDCIHYCNEFVACNVPGWDIAADRTDTIGLQLLYRFAGWTGIGFEGCLFIIAAFVAVSLGLLVYKYSPSVYWSYIIYLSMGFYIFTFSGLKQSVAMAFCMLAMIAVFENRPVQFVIFVVLAMVFHIPAIAFIIVYLVAHKKIDVSYFLLLGIMVAAVFLYRNQIVSWVSEMYYENETAFQQAEGIGGRFLMMLFIMGVALILRPLRNRDEKYRKVFNVMVLAAIAQTFSVYDNVFTRLADYFYQFIIIFIPMMLQPGEDQVLEQPERKYQIRYYTRQSYQLIGLCITVFAVYFYWHTLGQSSALLADFHFFWQTTDVDSSMELLQRSIEQWGR